jgi:NADH pyrophosphatase NudC (nudix superfamily)
MHPYFKQNYQFCPKCGTRLNSTKLQAHLVCSKCGFIIYPNPAPTTAVFVVKDQQVLLAKRGIEPKKGTWDSPGGFVDPGENLEQGAIREMREETGLEVKITDVIGSYPDTYQGKPTLNVGLLAAIIAGEPQAADDVSHLDWIDLDNLPAAKEFGFQTVYKLLQNLKHKLKY